MERWGNERVAGFWEACPALFRPKGFVGDSASRGLVDYIRAKYDRRLFAAAGEPGDWLKYLPMPNGWERHFDESSNYFYYSNGLQSTWEMPPEAVPAPPEQVHWWAGHEGWLEKKSGGKEAYSKVKLLLQKWDRRYFVLSACGTSLSYFKSDQSYRKREEPAGTVDCKGARAFLKQAQEGGVYRFTLVTRERELKLRATDAEFEVWASVLAPIVGEIETDASGRFELDE